MVRAFQWDLARQVERLDWLLAQLPRYADWGYQELYLHLEDAVEYPSLPGVARRDAYTHRQMQRLVDAAARVGIGVVPIVNLLGHTQYLIKVPSLRDLNELRGPGGGPLASGQICPVHPRTLEVADKLLHDVAPFCTAGKVHVGLDESFQLGRHPLSVRDIARHGLAGHFARYVQRLHALTQDRCLRLGMWADMLYFLPDAIPLLPRGIVAYDWYYYPFDWHPRVELFNFAERDLSRPLQARGIEYWGCPMNGAFRHETLPIFGERLANIRSWWDRCRRVNAGGMLVTSWESNRLAQEMTTVVDAAAATLWLEPGKTSDVAMLARGFERVFGERRSDQQSQRSGSRQRRSKSGAQGFRTPDETLPSSPWGYAETSGAFRYGAGRQSARAALAADRYPFAGYARWEINDRWDAVSGSPAPFKKEEAHFLAIDRPAGGLPEPLAMSLLFRAYLARRDACVRRFAEQVRELRRLLHSLGVQSPENWPQKGARISGAANQVSRAPIGAMKSLPEVESFLRLFAAKTDRRKSGISPDVAKVRRQLAEMQESADELGRELAAGDATARAMREFTRAPRPKGPNELMVVRDAARLKEWRRWLKGVARDFRVAWTASPVHGAQQLTFTVRNFAPALQKVAVEQQQSDGSWREVHSRFTIEFQAAAARPSADIRREFSTPVAAEGGLRIVVRGLGQVKIGRPTLTDGVTALAPHGWSKSQWKLLGRPAPKRGLPEIDW